MAWKKVVFNIGPYNIPYPWIEYSAYTFAYPDRPIPDYFPQPHNQLIYLLPFDMTGFTILNCFVNCEIGEVTISVAGGIPPYKYSYDNGVTLTDYLTGTTYTFTGLTGDTFVPYVEDSTGIFLTCETVYCTKKIMIIPVYLTPTATGYVEDPDRNQHTQPFEVNLTKGSTTEYVALAFPTNNTTFVGWTAYDIPTMSNYNSIQYNSTSLSFSFFYNNVPGDVIYAVFYKSGPISIEWCFYGDIPITTTTTTIISMVWYYLYNCSTAEITTSTSYLSGTFSLDQRVEYGNPPTLIYFYILSEVLDDPGGQHWEITSSGSGQIGCPVTTTTTTNIFNTITIIRYTDSTDSSEACGKIIPAIYPSEYFSLYTYGTWTPETQFQLYADKLGNIFTPDGFYKWAILYPSNTVGYTAWVTYSGIIMDWLSCVETTTTTTIPPTTTTTTTLLYYFRLSDCTIGEYAETGPYPDGTYNSGERVEGDTNHFYVVSGSQLTTWGYNNIIVTHTGYYNCP